MGIRGARVVPSEVPVEGKETRWRGMGATGVGTPGPSSRGKTEGRSEPRLEPAPRGLGTNSTMN